MTGMAAEGGVAPAGVAASPLLLRWPLGLLCLPLVVLLCRPRVWRRVCGCFHDCVACLIG